jgi:hypothetical protein
MVETNQGLTKTCNALKDPACEDPRVLELRRLHEAMDRAVLDAYGWGDVPVPPYCPASDAERAAVQAFEDEVIDRLYVVNAERGREELRSAEERRPPVLSRPTAMRAVSYPRLPAMNDTHPTVERMMLEGYRRMTPAEKLARCGDLSSTVRQLAAARIRREHPDADDREIRIRVAALLYPADLLKRAVGWEPATE